jgi:hypothetical protein
MPSGKKTSDELSAVVSRMLAAQKDVIEIMAFTGISKRQIQRIQHRLKATGESSHPANTTLPLGRPRILDFDDVEVSISIST